MKRILRAVALILLVVFGALLLVGGSAYAYFHTRPLPPADQITWGVSFSQTMSEQMGEDWRAAYLSILDDLHPGGVRLIAYWNRLEPSEGTYDFADLDWQVQQATARKIPVILTVGQKVPRWPECFVPGWASGSQKPARLLTYLQHVAEHYRNSPGLASWQLENEPFLSFGECASADPALIDQELALLRRIDPTHPIMLTDGGEWGGWYAPASRGDIFGSTMYRQVYSGELDRVTTYALPPEYYQAKALLIRWLTGKPDLPVIISELGLEPWGKKLVYEMSLAEQESFLSPATFAQNLAYARSAKFTTYYLWGAEWWYSAKQHGEPAYWEQVKSVLATGKR